MHAAGQLTRGRIAAALAVAVVTDLVQLPFSVLFFTGVFSVPSEAVDIFLDTVAFASTTVLLGFHWALLPTFALELVPVMGAMPTWTGCVVFVIWRRKQALVVPERGCGPTAGPARPAVTLHRDDKGSYSVDPEERDRSQGA